MPIDSPDDAPDRAPGPRPLSRRATRLFVIGAILFIIAATLGGTYYLVGTTSRALDAPVDTSITDTTAVDSTTARTSPLPTTTRSTQTQFSPEL